MDPVPSSEVGWKLRTVIFLMSLEPTGGLRTAERGYSICIGGVWQMGALSV